MTLMRLRVLLFLIFKQHLAIVIEMFSTFSRDIWNVFHLLEGYLRIFTVCRQQYNPV